MTFALLALVTAVAVALSLRRDSLFIAVLGLLGGFATPALLLTLRAGTRRIVARVGLPPSTHAVIISSCSEVSARSLRKSLKPLIAPHGGMRRESTSSLIATAQGRASA